MKGYCDVGLSIPTVLHALQVAEERALGGVCGSACCRKLLLASKPKGAFRIGSQQQRFHKGEDVQYCRYTASLSHMPEYPFLLLFSEGCLAFYYLCPYTRQGC